MEPENLLAIYLLAKREYYPSYIVVGKGSPHTKIIRIKTYISLLKNEGLYPQDLDPIIIEGYTLKSTDEIKHSKSYVDLLNSFNEKGGIFISLKTPLELNELYKDINLNNIAAYFCKVVSHFDILRKFKSVHMYDSSEYFRYSIETKSLFLEHFQRLVLLKNRYNLIKIEKILTEILCKSFDNTLSLVDYVKILPDSLIEKFLKYYIRYKTIIHNEDTLIHINQIGLVLNIGNTGTCISGEQNLFIYSKENSYDTILKILLK